MLEHAADLAVAPFREGHGEPDIVALLAVDGDVHRAVVDALDGDAFGQLLEGIGVGIAVGARPIAPHPPGRGELHPAGELAVVGEQQQPFRVHVEPADRDDPRQIRRQVLEHRRPPLRVVVRGHEPARLVVAPEPRRCLLRDRLAVDGDAAPLVDDDGGRLQHLAVDRHPAFRDPALRLAPGAQARPRQPLRDALAFRFVFGHGPSQTTAMLGGYAADLRSSKWGAIRPMLPATVDPGLAAAFRLLI